MSKRQEPVLLDRLTMRLRLAEQIGLEQPLNGAWACDRQGHPLFRLSQTSPLTFW